MKIEEKQFLVGRFDHYFDSVNNKGNFLLTFNTFILGSIVLTYQSVITLICSENKQIFNICILMFSLLALSSLFCSLLAIFPYLKGESSIDKKYKSILFFGSIATFDEKEFINKITTSTELQLNKDFNIQIFLLSKGLAFKYKWLKRAGWCILFEILMFIPLIITIIKNN